MRRVKPGYQEFPGVFYYTVFNYEQTEGLTLKAPNTKKKTEEEKIESAQKIVRGMPNRPHIIKQQGDRAFYRLNTDEVTMPLVSQFTSEQEYYSVLFHELVHSTGARKSTL